MQSEGISRKADRNAIIRRHIHGRRSRSPDPLHRYLLRRQRNAVLLPFFNDRGADLIIALVRVGARYHHNILQIVFERIVVHFRWRDLKSGVDHADDRNKSQYCFYGSHVPHSALHGTWVPHFSRSLREVGTSRSPAEQLLKVFDYRGDRNIAYFASRT